MPPLPQRTNSMPMSVRLAIIMASWPAPLGSRRATLPVMRSTLVGPAHPAGRGAGCAGGFQHPPLQGGHAAPRGDLLDRGADVRIRGVARRIAVGAHVDGVRIARESH
jgi:hypothetical protein